MKTHITLRSTLSNASWIQRGAVALLLIAALMATLALALQSNTSTPASTPVVRQATPAARDPNLPGFGTGSVYDGGSYVTRRPAVRNPNLPGFGTGSVYDGQ